MMWMCENSLTFAWLGHPHHCWLVKADYVIRFQDEAEPTKTHPLGPDTTFSAKISIFPPTPRNRFKLPAVLKWNQWNRKARVDRKNYLMFILEILHWRWRWQWRRWWWQWWNRFKLTELSWGSSAEETTVCGSIYTSPFHRPLQNDHIYQMFTNLLRCYNDDCESLMINSYTIHSSAFFLKMLKY